MFGDYSRELLRQGVIEQKAGNRATARRYLDRALYLSADPEVIADAWYWMSQTTEDTSEKRAALENCLANDLHHSEARRALAILDGRLRPEDIVDPNQLPPQPQAGGQERRFVCPKCGGRMAYSPDGRSLVCEYCRRHQTIVTEADARGDNDFIVAMATLRGHGQPLRERVLRCQGCGAEFMLPPATLSFTCAYCDSPHVAEVRHAQGLIEPHGVVPHSFQQRRAADLLAAWLISMKIRPEKPLRAPRGLYVPIWSFDFAGSIGYTREVTRQEADSYAESQSTRETVRGDYPVLMTVTVAGSRRPSAPLVRLISEFNPGLAQPYDARFLAAWPAELYDVSMAEASLEARGVAYGRLKRDLPALLSPVQLITTSSADLSIDRFRLDLMPVWAVELFVQGRGGVVLINGQSGSVSGDAFARTKKTKGGMTVWVRDMIND